ncbi:methyl-accepting chemotaxis protein [Pseudoduganella lurida]|uniref:Methyl-accepting chemotaxis protein n=1 Tax=Pseudoduganella lurida TaxID=1036180 RepID=A0A562RAB7_9BURK|nr:methyl-accepting chemotaxis protein [Pseudoduganella lurida]TWI65336.1 methyl-accepting chemotaxis protein [Pseudoduganella lurida]
MNLQNLKIGTRLSAGFTAVLALLLGIAWLGLHNMAALQSDLRRVTEVNNTGIHLASEMRSDVVDRMIALRNLALLTDAKELEPEVKRIEKDAARYAESNASLSKLFEANNAGAEERALLAKIQGLSRDIQPLIEKASALGLAHERDEATRVLLHEVRPIQFQWQAALTDLVAREEKINEDEKEEGEKAYETARMVVFGLTALAVVAGFAIARFTSRSITKPLAQAVAVAQTVAAGDLRTQIDVRSSDETGQLLEALRAMSDSLGGIVAQVRSGTETITSASDEIATGNLDLSSRTEQQASALEETASSMEELAAAVSHNAGSARTAAEMAEATRAVASQGGEAVGEVVRTMESIDASAKKIVDIIAVIDGIAFQTNILALNAAVEAARAGEQGRGFAVVASEVRNLAQRSASAAQEVKALITDSVSQVEQGSALVNRAGATMREVVASVERMTSVVGEISNATHEQEAGIQQINQAVSDMDATTQQNAALVEEAAAAAASLQDQAKELSGLVSVFQLPASSSAPRLGVTKHPLLAA